MLKKILFTLGALLTALSVYAQETKTAWLAVRYDLDSTNMTYCTVTGGGNTPSPFDHTPLVGYSTVTAAASTTLAEADASYDSLTGVAAKDLLIVDVSGTPTPREVLDVTGVPDSVTIDEAITVTSGKYTFYNHNCGTTASDGWVYVGNLSDLTVSINLKQVSVTGGVDFRVEGAMGIPDGSSHNTTQLWPTDKTVGGSATVQNLTTAGITSNVMINVSEPVDYIRVGMLIHTADDGGDLTTNAEQISIVLFGRYFGSN